MRRQLTSIGNAPGHSRCAGRILDPDQRRCRCERRGYTVVAMEGDVTQANIASASRAVGGAAAPSAPVPFHEQVTIQRLLAPITEEEFRTRYWEKKPLIVHRG